MSHNIPAGGAARDYYEEFYGRDDSAEERRGEEIDAQLDFESQAESFTPSQGNA